MTTSTKSILAERTFRQLDQVIRHNRIDQTIFRNAATAAPIMDEAAEASSGSKVGPDVAARLMFDTFNVYHKHAPTTTGLGGPLEKELIAKLQRTEDYHITRQYTQADEVASALASAATLQTIVAAIPDEVKEKAKDAAEKEEQAKDAEGFADATAESPDATPDEVKDSAEDAAKKRKQADAAAKALAESMQLNGRKITAAVERGSQQGKQQAVAVGMGGQAFGTASTEVMKGLPIEQRFALAKRFAGAGPRFAKLLALIGRLSREALTKQASKTTHDAGEIVDTAIGSDIDNIMEDELALMAVPALRAVQMAAFAEDRMLMHEVESKEPLARGAIVVLHDESGSMSGQAEEEAKALSIALAHVAAKQRRAFVHHFFQTRVTHTVTIEPGDDTKIENGVPKAVAALAAIAERGTAGGTQLDEPLARAIESVAARKQQKPDVLILTDGDAGLAASTIEMVAKARKELGCHFYVMLIGRSASGLETVRRFADKVWNVDSIVNDGAASELFDVL